MSNENEQYLRSELIKLVEARAIANFQIKKQGNEYHVAIDASGIEVLLVGDAEDYMEMSVGGYYKEVTDYLQGDYRQTIDWYLMLIQKLGTGDYDLEIYEKKGAPICKYLLFEHEGHIIRVGDRKNHIKFLAQKRDVPGKEALSLL